MTKEQFNKLNEILTELEYDWGYGPSFVITESMNIDICKNNIFKDFHNYKMEIIDDVLNESKNNILKALNEL